MTCSGRDVEDDGNEHHHSPGTRHLGRAAEHFEHYFRTSRCTFAVTVDVDVTELVSKLRDSRRNGRTFMPLAVQVHDASADGFHVAWAVADLEQLFAEPPGWTDRPC